jgi:succinate dehydrogenase/fumarate reductase flavoprotein subunit
MATESTIDTDVIVIGAGGTGLVAALAARRSGAETLVLEKAPKIGGATAVSGGGMWLPNSHPVVDAVGETPQGELLEYLRRVSGDQVPEPLLETFLETCPETAAFIEEESPLSLQFAYYPDYHAEWDGGDERGRMVEPQLYDADRLGERASDIRDNPHTPVPVPVREMVEAGGMAKYPVEADPETIRERRAANKLANGEALIAGLYEACLESGVRVETDAAAERLTTDDGEVDGLVATLDGTETDIEADAVVIAAGGMEWNEKMCETFLNGPMTAPISPPQNEGDGIQMGMEVGADLGNMGEAWWFPAAHIPGEEWADGSPLNRMIISARTLPGSLMVNADGDRFCNEANNYNDLGKSFSEFDAHAYDHRNVPAWAIFDQSYRDRYAVLSVRPDDETPEWMIRAETVADLSEQTGIDEDGLRETLARFNDHAREGVDPEFHRGESPHDRHAGDPEADHPNLGPVDEPPYYAFEVKPGCIGTKGGLVTDTDAAVLDVRGERIDGLYAASNSTAHVMGIGYAGGGGTIGPNVVFGHIAGQNAAERAGQ